MKTFRKCVECGRKLTNRMSEKCQICRSKVRWQRRDGGSLYELIKPATCIRCRKEFYPVKVQFCGRCLKKEKFLKEFWRDA